MLSSELKGAMQSKEAKWFNKVLSLLLFIKFKKTKPKHACNTIRNSRLITVSPSVTLLRNFYVNNFVHKADLPDFTIFLEISQFCTKSLENNKNPILIASSLQKLNVISYMPLKCI